MSEDVMKAIIRTIYDGKGVNDAKQDIQGIQKEANNTGNVLSKAFEIGKFAVFGEAIKRATMFIADMSKKSADYIETLNVLEVAFDGNTQSIRNFTSQMAKTLNLDESTLISAAAHFKVLSKSMGMATETGEKLSELMTKMTLDLSSLYNMDFDKAQTALQYAMEGRGTSLKQRTGVSVLETSVQTTLDTLGVDAYVEDMNDAEKALARVITMEYQLMSSQGDLARTIEAPANQMRVMGEQLQMLARNIGNVFLPVVAAVLPYLNAFFIILNKIISALARLVGYKEGMFDTFEESNAIDYFDGVGGAIDGVGKSADKTAKKLQGLRGFDKLNVIRTPEPTSGGGGGAGGGGGGINPNLLKAFNSMADKYKTMLDGLETKATRIANQIIGWVKGLVEFNKEANKTQLESIGKSVKSIGESMNYIFSSDALQKSAKNFADSIKKALDSVVKNAITIGINLADGIIGGFAQFLDSKKQDIVDDLTRAFDIGTAFNNAVSEFTGSLADISSVFTGDNFKGIVESVYSTFYEVFANVKLLAAQSGTDIFTALTDPINNNADKIREALDGSFGWLKTILETIEGIVTNIFDSIWSAYDSTIKPMIDGISEFMSKNLGQILDSYNKYISPVIDSITKRVSELYKNYINPIITEIIGILADLGAIIVEIWKRKVQPVIDWITKKVVPVLMPVIKVLADSVINTAESILSAIKMVLGILQGLLDFVVGVFTGDWEKAFEGIKEIIDAFKTRFEEIFGGIIEWLSQNVILPIQTMFQEVWDKIVKIFSPIVDFFAKLFKPIVENIKIMKDDIIIIITFIWNKIVEIFGKATQWVSDTIINPIKEKINELKDWFDNKITNAQQKIEEVKRFIINKFTEAKNAVKNTFSPLVDFFSNLWDKIKAKCKSAGSTIGNAVGGAFKNAINGVLSSADKVINAPIKGINSLLDKIREIPGLKGLKKLNAISIPRMAEGGLPQVGQMFIANERGAELVGHIGGQSFVANQNQVLDLIDKKLQNAGGLNNATFIVQVGDEQIAKKVLKDLNGMAKSNGKTITIGG
jgi:phage-related protein